MFVPSVYSAIMQMNDSPALLRRIGRLLHAKQFLVFYAIGLTALSLTVQLVAGRLRDPRGLDELLLHTRPPFHDLAAARSVAVAAVVVVYLALMAWFTAGYLRSLLGRLHWGPFDGRQFGRVLGLVVIYGLIDWGFSAAYVALGADEPDAALSDRAVTYLQLGYIAEVAVDLVLLYAFYAVIVSEASLLGSLRRSLTTVRDNWLISVLMAGVPLATGMILSPLVFWADSKDMAVQPTIVALVLIWGCVSFLADVVLITVYVDTIERKRPGRAL